ncbi:MAG: hypothetical protein ABJB34_04135 [Acidobacteriota bacterium]
MKLLCLLCVLVIASANGVHAQTLKFDEFVTSGGPTRYFFDDYKDYDDRLKRFILKLRTERQATNVYLVHYRPRISSSTYDQAEQRAERAKWEVGYKTKIKPENIYVIDGGLRDGETVEFWLGRKGSQPPVPTPTYTNSQAVLCPSIFLNAQGFQFDDNQSAAFAVELRPAMETRLEWSVTDGRILDGQGTREISVDVKGIKATRVSVTALDIPSECDRHETLLANIGIRPYLIDEYGRLPSSDIRGRLDAFLVSLSETPSLTGYILIYGDRSLPGSPDSIEKLLRNHFMFRNFDMRRIVIVKAGYRETFKTQLWLLPPGVSAPAARPSVDASFVPPKTTTKRRRK